MKAYKRPIQRSIILGSALFITFMCFILSLQSYLSFSKSLYQRYDDRLDNIVNYVHSQIDADDLYNCVQTKEHSEKYDRLQQTLNGMVDEFELFYLYIVFTRDTLMINVVSATSQAERDRGETDLPLLYSSEGYSYEEIQKYNRVLEQSEIKYFEEDSEWGAAYTACKPLANSSGKKYALICADISIEALHKTVNSYVLYNVVLTLILGLLFGFILIVWLRYNITGPILALEKSARKFAENSRNHKDPSELVFDTPTIHTENEVESLSRAISQMSEDMRKYIQSIVSAEEKIKSAQETAADMTLLAYKDALTHVGSKIAYDRAIRALENEISENKIPFAIAMIDLNNLKNINDGYGHSNGNCYIFGTCHIICSIFRHSPVFRIGGDEFIVILRDSDYENRHVLIEQARQKFYETESDNSRDPWERFSAAVGIAEYHSGDTVDMVFKNADKDMYENKMSMKNKN